MMLALIVIAASSCKKEEEPLRMELFNEYTYTVPIVDANQIVSLQVMVPAAFTNKTIELCYSVKITGCSSDNVNTFYLYKIPQDASFNRKEIFKVYSNSSCIDMPIDLSYNFQGEVFDLEITIQLDSVTSL